MHHSFCQNLTRLLLMLSDWMNNSWDTVTWQSCFVVIGSLLFWIKFPLLTHLRDSNVESISAVSVYSQSELLYGHWIYRHHDFWQSDRGLRWEENKENRDCEAVYYLASYTARKYLHGRRSMNHSLPFVMQIRTGGHLSITLNIMLTTTDR